MLFKTGLNNRTDTLINNLNLGENIATLPIFSQIVVTVTDIILDETHPKYEAWTDIEAIFTEPVDNTSSTGLLKSYPLFSQLKVFPLVNEQIILITIQKGILLN